MTAILNHPTRHADGSLWTHFVQPSSPDECRVLTFFLNLMHGCIHQKAQKQGDNKEEQDYTAQ